MIIETGNPRETGHYVCYMHGVETPTVIRFWLAGGHGWLNNLKEPIAGTVAGWIGPLPYMELSAQALYNEWASKDAEIRSNTVEWDL